MNDKTDAFDEFPDMEPLKEVEIIDATQETTKQASQSVQGGYAAYAVQIAIDALHGNFNTVLQLSVNEVKALLNYLQTNPVNSVEESDTEWAEEEGPMGPTPSEEKAAAVQQTPEEIERERDFLDSLGI